MRVGVRAQLHLLRRIKELPAGDQHKISAEILESNLWMLETE